MSARRAQAHVYTEKLHGSLHGPAIGMKVGCKTPTSTGGSGSAVGGFAGSAGGGPMPLMLKEIYMRWEYQVLFSRDFHTWKKELRAWGDLCMPRNGRATLHALGQQHVRIDRIVAAMLEAASASPALLSDVYDRIIDTNATVNTLTEMMAQHSLAREHAIKLRRAAQVHLVYGNVSQGMADMPVAQAALADTQTYYIQQ